jgi:hypothetical protein
VGSAHPTNLRSLQPKIHTMKRTDNKTLNDINDAPDLQKLVQDKRSQKRATTAKASRRNRRYENRILSAHTEDEFDDREDAIIPEDSEELG